MEANKPCNSGFPLPFFPLADRRSHFLWFFENTNEPAKFFFWQVFIVDTKLLAVKDNQFFISTALEIFDCFQIFFQFIGNGGLGSTLAVFFVSFPNIPDTASSCRTSTTGTHKKIPEDNVFGDRSVLCYPSRRLCSSSGEAARKSAPAAVSSARLP